MVNARRWQVWELVGEGRVASARPGYAHEREALDRVPVDGVAVVTCNGLVVHATPGLTAPQRARLAEYAADHWLRLTPPALRPRLEPVQVLHLRLAPEPAVRHAPLPRCTYVARTGRPCRNGRAPLATGDDGEFADLCRDHRALCERRAERIAV